MSVPSGVAKRKKKRRPRSKTEAKRQCGQIVQRKRARIFIEQGGKCFFCRRKVRLPAPGEQNRLKDPQLATLEHLVPLSRGGTNDESNVVVSCFRCNRRKGRQICTRKHYRQAPLT